MVLDNIKKKRGRSSFHGRRHTLSIFQLPKYLRYHLSFICRRRKRLNRKGNNNTEKGECASSSKDKLFFCEICTDMKAMKDVFCINGCSHAYCSDCVAMYIGSKLKDNIIDIRCPFPGCSGSLEADYCQSILPDDLFDRWGKASCEALIDDSVKFYCPFADCSALLINDEKEAVIKAECPYCERMFCAQCKVPWHEGIECSEFEKLNADERGKEDVMLVGLAKDKKWMRCPNCRIYVARSRGCNSMKCRLPFLFNILLLCDFVNIEHYTTIG
jgi:E3 ubiquitin-protein ligase RNF144